MLQKIKTWWHPELTREWGKGYYHLLPLMEAYKCKCIGGRCGALKTLMHRVRGCSSKFTFSPSTWAPHYSVPSHLRQVWPWPKPQPMAGRHKWGSPHPGPTHERLPDGRSMLISPPAGWNETSPEQPCKPQAEWQSFHLPWIQKECSRGGSPGWHIYSPRTLEQEIKLLLFEPLCISGLFATAISLLSLIHS